MGNVSTMNFLSTNDGATKQQKIKNQITILEKKIHYKWNIFYSFFFFFVIKF